jgi:hypothetical protein
MHLPTTRWLVSTDRQERNFNRKAGSDFFESCEIGTITAMKNRPLSQTKMKATESAIPVMEDAGAPVMARRESDGHVADVEMLPFT